MWALSIFHRSHSLNHSLSLSIQTIAILVTLAYYHHVEHTHNQYVYMYTDTPFVVTLEMISSRMLVSVSYHRRRREWDITHS